MHTTYLILNEDDETGYTMGVYLAKNIQVQNIKPEYADDYENTMVSFAIYMKDLNKMAKYLLNWLNQPIKLRKRPNKKLVCLPWINY